MRTSVSLNLLGHHASTGSASAANMHIPLLPPVSSAATAAAVPLLGPRRQLSARTAPSQQRTRGPRVAAAASPTPPHSSSSPAAAAAAAAISSSRQGPAGGASRPTPGPAAGGPPHRPLGFFPAAPAAAPYLPDRRRDGGSGSPTRPRGGPGGSSGNVAVAAVPTTGSGAGSGGSSSGPAGPTAGSSSSSSSSASRRGSVAAAANSSAAAVAYNSRALGMSSAGAAARRRFAAANRRNGNSSSNNPLVLLYDRAAAAVGDLTNATSNVLPSFFDIMDTLEFELTELGGQLASSLAGSGLLDALGLMDGGGLGGMENELGDVLGQLADAVVAASEGDYSKLLLLAYVSIAVGFNATRPPASPYLAGNYGPVSDTLRVSNLPILNYPTTTSTTTTSEAATGTAAAVMTAAAAAAGPAAGGSSNSTGAGVANGVAANGVAANGVAANGVAANGVAANGVAANGVAANGVLPEGLPDGYYVRAGPNPYHQPAAGYHWFDGDGMLHGVRLRRGSASYANAWVETERLKQERALGHPLLFRIGDMVGVKGVALMLLGLFAERMGTVRLDKGTGTANTALAFHAGQLLALHDDDLPYAVRVADDGGIETTGRVEYRAASSSSGGKCAALSLPNLVSHPKIDPVNGDLLFVSNQFQVKPWTQAGIIDKHGQLTKLWPLDIEYPVVMHDMAATQKYIIVLHLPLCVDPKRMLQEDASPVSLRRDLPNRIGLVRRDALSQLQQRQQQQQQQHDGASSGYQKQPRASGHRAQAQAPPPLVQWFEVPGPGFGVFHVVNAWDEGEHTVKLYACQQDNAKMDLAAMDCATDTSHLTEYVLDTSSSGAGTAGGTAGAVPGAVRSRRMSAVSADFPVVAPSRVTLPSRYSWMAMLATEGTMTAVTGIAKMDLGAPEGAEACVATIRFPPGWSGGEAVFVPRDRRSSSGSSSSSSSGSSSKAGEAGEQEQSTATAAAAVAVAAEAAATGQIPSGNGGARTAIDDPVGDDGFLLVYVYSSTENTSYLHVYDARTMAPQPLAAVRLPRRVPYGFHGAWVTEEQLQTQMERKAAGGGAGGVGSNGNDDCDSASGLGEEVTERREEAMVAAAVGSQRT
ncbi:hypothetical protein HYH02_013191 [Chlamydomonas schloesseri]|uniref:carotenoid 9,10-dioxygenase n=1 Tax=Chlamydomonas schloesseri TaxID=2026947 RepID=A0A835T5B2_9CHLO|nr:hypothetical protein HYH02_013191 [Chlamydomonas schloesseri]|eukprot:KAG2431975.1 hypothetical protein HYH02_013191 [Chlamydomonas schloesseri]